MIHTLWRQRVGSAGDSRELRHAYINEVTRGRATETKSLTQVDAKRVIQSLLADQRSHLRLPDAASAHAAGTHGRRGQDQAEEMLIGAPQIALLQDMQQALGWDRPRMEGFIERQLGPGRQIRTMRQFNRVLWGLKAMQRRAAAESRATSS